VQVESDEVKTNILAAYVAGGQGSEVPGLISRLRVNIKGSFELAYNRACALVATGKLEEAETALKLAIKQGELPHDLIALLGMHHNKQFGLQLKGAACAVAPGGMFCTTANHVGIYLWHAQCECRAATPEYLLLCKLLPYTLCECPPAGEEVLYDEEFTEGEVLDELAALSTQLAYVLGLQGQHEAALERLDPLVSGHLSDPAVGAVAANNWVVDSYASGGAQCNPGDRSCGSVLHPVMLCSAQHSNHVSHAHTEGRRPLRCVHICCTSFLINRSGMRWQPCTACQHMA
jgi:hypothetical protein